VKIGITGSDGLIGWHLRAYLRVIRDDEVRLANRTTFAEPARIGAFVTDLDAIIHFAGVNRGEELEVEAANVALARELAAACERKGSRPFLVFANSTQEGQDTGYGRGKRAAAEILQAWATRSGARFTNLILPHVFGEFGRPFHNSVVSTFCHQLSRGETPQIIADGRLELLHAQDVAVQCLDVIREDRRGQIRLTGSPLIVSELLARLTKMRDSYGSHILPPLDSPLDVRLFNTLRSYLFPAHYPVDVTLRTDTRGTLFEVIKSSGGGQVFMSTTHPGITRGNHFHTRKVERFLVAGGDAEICLRKLFSDRITRFKVSGAKPCYVDIPTFHAHNITNVGESELVTLFWANEIFDPTDPDTYAEPVENT